jgi:hypothetical protein
VKRRHIPKPAQNTCDKCGRFFVYFRLCRPKRFCSQPSATKFNNDHFNGLETAAR